MTTQTSIALAALLALFLTAGFLRLNDRSVYSDSTRYLIWGNSLASGNGFVDDTRPVPTRFVMNAPLCSVLLVPVALFFPLSVTAAKIWTLVWGAAALVMLFLWLRSHFSLFPAIIASAFLAFNPLMLISATEILSEAPFLCFSLAVLWMFDRFLQAGGKGSPPLLFIAVLAFLPLLREVGVAFVIAALALFFREKSRKAFLTTAIAAGALFLLWTARNLLVGADEPGESANLQFVLGRFATGPEDSLLAELESRFWLNLKGYAWSIGGAVFHPFPDNLIVTPSAIHESVKSVFETIRPAMTAIAAGLTAHGIALDRPSTQGGLFRVLVASVYVVIILLYPVHDIRFLLPLLPLVLFYILRSTTVWIERIRPDALRSVAGITLSAVLVLPNVWTDVEIVRTNIAYRANPSGFSRTSGDARWFGQPWSILGEWFAINTPEDAVIAAPAKDLAAFVRPRKVLEASRALPTPILERLLRDHTAGYLVTTIAWDEFETFEIAMAESERLWFERVHKVADLVVYKVHSAFLSPRPLLPGSLPDTSTARGKILLGRQELHRLKYEKALALFGAATRQEPAEPEPLFQVMTVLSIVGDSAAAMELNSRLFTLPRSTAYSAIAQAQIGAMLQLRRAERQSGIERGYTAFEAGLAYWTLGYRSSALAVMRNIAKSDSSHFSAALWGCYYAKQLGDTVESYEFLKRLRKIDITAPIVSDWEAMRKLEEQTRKTRSARERATIHREISAIYAKLELYDEALDALERAHALIPDDVGILVAHAQLFEKKRALWGAQQTYRRILELEPAHKIAREKLGMRGVE